VSYDSLKELHTALVDANAGYETAVDDTDSDGVRNVFVTALEQHAAAQEEIYEMLVSLGIEPDPDGSFMSTVHKTVISLRSSLTGLNENALGAFADGEERILAKYDTTLDEDLDTGVAEMLTRQHAQVVALIGQLRAQAE